MTARLRLDVVIPGSSLGGAERLLLELLHEARSRLDVRVVSLGDGGLPEFETWLSVATGAGAPAIVRAAAVLAHAWRSDAPDVVLANGIKAAATALPAAAAAGVAAVWFKHDFSFDRRLARPLARLADAVVTSGPNVAEATRRRDAVILLPPRPLPPLPASEARRELGLSSPVLACVGRLVTYKGVDDAIRAIAQDGPTEHGWRLAVIGTDDASAAGEESRLRVLAAGLGVLERVDFLGDIPDAGRFLSGVDVVAVLTKSTGDDRGREGWSLVADEAMAAGVPVVASRGGGVADRLGGAGIAVDPGAPDQVADALVRLADPAVRRAMGRAGQMSIEKRPGSAEQAAELVRVLAAVARRPGAGRTDTPPVSVVVPAFREGEAVRSTIFCILRQFEPADELVVVHDPADTESTDDTGAVLDELAEGAAQMRVIHRPSGARGISSARNNGIAAAAHPLIVCTDIGCTPRPGWLDALRAALADTPEPALATGVYDVTGGQPFHDAMALACYPVVEEARRRPPLQRLYGSVLGRSFDPTLPTGRSMAFTRSAWELAGGFPEGLATAEDVTFGMAIVGSGGSAVLAADAVVEWVQRPSVTDTARMYFRYGVGDGASRNVRLVTRNGVRAAAYVLGAAALGAGGRRTRVAASAGAAFYLSLPLARARARRSRPGAILLIPAAMALKDGAKIAGCIVGLRHRR